MSSGMFAHNGGVEFLVSNDLFYTLLHGRASHLVDMFKGRNFQTADWLPKTVDGKEIHAVAVMVTLVPKSPKRKAKAPQ